MFAVNSMIITVCGCHIFSRLFSPYASAATIMNTNITTNADAVTTKSGYLIVFATGDLVVPFISDTPSWT